MGPVSSQMTTWRTPVTGKQAVLSHGLCDSQINLAVNWASTIDRPQVRTGREAAGQRLASTLRNYFTWGCEERNLQYCHDQPIWVYIDMEISVMKIYCSKPVSLMQKGKNGGKYNHPAIDVSKAEYSLKSTSLFGDCKVPGEETLSRREFFYHTLA